MPNGKNRKASPSSASYRAAMTNKGLVHVYICLLLPFGMCWAHHFAQASSISFPALLGEFSAIKASGKVSQPGLQLRNAHGTRRDVHVEQGTQFPGIFLQHAPLVP